MAKKQQVVAPVQTESLAPTLTPTPSTKRNPRTKTPAPVQTPAPEVQTTISAVAPVQVPSEPQSSTEVPATKKQKRLFALLLGSVSPALTLSKFVKPQEEVVPPTTENGEVKKRKQRTVSVEETGRHGNYYGENPMQAAKKAFNKFIEKEHKLSPEAINNLILEKARSRGINNPTEAQMKEIKDNEINEFPETVYNYRFTIVEMLENKEVARYEYKGTRTLREKFEIVTRKTKKDDPNSAEVTYASKYDTSITSLKPETTPQVKPTKTRKTKVVAENTNSAVVPEVPVQTTNETVQTETGTTKRKNQKKKN